MWCAARQFLQGIGDHRLFLLTADQLGLRSDDALAQLERMEDLDRFRPPLDLLRRNRLELHSFLRAVVCEAVAQDRDPILHDQLILPAGRPHQARRKVHCIANDRIFAPGLISDRSAENMTGRDSNMAANIQVRQFLADHQGSLHAARRIILMGERRQPEGCHEW